MAESTSSFDPRERFARSVVQKLTAAGYIAYFAGGCVRDRILGREAKDFDVATNATPERIREIFGLRRTLAIGAAFGVISVLGRKGAGEDPIEVATFRSDGNYSDGRHPDSVVFSTPQEDAQRRDFTINGLFYDPLQEQVIDFVGGRADLQSGLLRAIGNPEARIAEDKLRMLRAVRMAAVFGFTIDDATMRAVEHHAAEIVTVSNERIGAEVRRILACDSAHRGFELLIASGLSSVVFPGLSEIWTAPPNRQPEALKLRETQTSGRQLLCDLLIARRDPDFVSGFACCLLVGQWTRCELDSQVRQWGDCWRLSNDETSRAMFAVSSLPTILQADRLPWSVVQPVLAARDAADAVRLAETVSDACCDANEAVVFARTRLNCERSELDPPHLINGNALQKLGFPAGPKFREILHDVRCRQLDATLTDSAAAVEYVLHAYRND